MAALTVVAPLSRQRHSTAHALVWLLSSLADTRYPVHLHGDATSVGFGADGRQNVPQLQSVERLHLRPLFQLCHAVVAGLSFHHVPAHSGQLDNELVDSIAKALTFQQWSPFVGIPNIEDLLTMPLFDWAWLLIEKEVNYNKEYPSLDDLIEGRGYTALPSKPVAVFPQAPEVPEDAVECHISIGLFFANVRTLKGVASDPAMSDKVDILAQQFIDSNLDIVALQETRSKTSSTSLKNGFLRLTAAAHSGQGGVELWFNQFGNLATSEFGPVRQEHCHVWHTSSTLLGVECDHPLLACDIVVIYAPQSSHTVEVIDKWWVELNSLLHARGKKETILLGDCNAKIGSVESEEIGPVHGLGFGRSGRSTPQTHCL